jgi:hypothetical protein
MIRPRGKPLVLTLCVLALITILLTQAATREMLFGWLRREQPPDREYHVIPSPNVITLPIQKK